MLGSLKHSFQIYSSKITNKIGEAFGFYGRPVAEYAKATKDLFNECYFLELWIKELLTTMQKRSSEEEILLTKLSRISKFLQEQILALVIGDMHLLLEAYYLEQTKVMLSPQRT